MASELIVLIWKLKYEKRNVSNSFIPLGDPSFAELLPIFVAQYLSREGTLMWQCIHKMDEADLHLIEW